MSVASLREALPLPLLFLDLFLADISLHCVILFLISSSLFVHEIPCPLFENYPGLIIQ